MSTVKKKPEKRYEPVWIVGYGSRTLTLASPTKEDSIREACERDPVLAALPLASEPLITSDGFACMAEVEEEDIL